MDIDTAKSFLVTMLLDYRWIILIIVVLLIIISLFYKHRYYYEKKEYLCSRSEQKFLNKLLSLLPKQYCVHCQTSLIALLKPADLRSAKMVWAKRMDFVITDRDSRILLVIELDDKSHAQKDRKKRDKFVNKALNGKHPLLRITTEKAKDLAYVRTEIERLLD